MTSQLCTEIVAQVKRIELVFLHGARFLQFNFTHNSALRLILWLVVGPGFASLGFCEIEAVRFLSVNLSLPSLRVTTV